MDLADCGKSAVAPISCADYPLLLARLCGHLTKAQVKTIFDAYMDKFQKNKQSGAYSVWGYNMSICTQGATVKPKRGDSVFLSSGGDSVVSFGNQHLDAAGAVRRSLVNRTTIPAMQLLYGAQNTKFCAPVWAGAFG